MAEFPEGDPASIVQRFAALHGAKGRVYAEAVAIAVAEQKVIKAAAAEALPAVAEAVGALSGKTPREL